MLTVPQIQRLLDIANTGCHTGHVGQARNIYEGILAFKPGFVPARIGLAYSHLVIDEFGEAEAMLKDILSANPDDADAQALLGLVYILAGHPAEARTLLEPLAAGEGSRADLAANLLKTA